MARIIHPKCEECMQRHPTKYILKDLEKGKRLNFCSLGCVGKHAASIAGCQHYAYCFCFDREDYL